MIDGRQHREQRLIRIQRDFRRVLRKAQLRSQARS
jgi:hypothetical protein